MSISSETIRTLDAQEKTEIAARLRGGENAHDLAWQFRVPALWVLRIANAIDRASAMAKREKLRRSRVQSVAARAQSSARKLHDAPATAPSMKALCSMDSIRITKREGQEHDR